MKITVNGVTIEVEASDNPAEVLDFVDALKKETNDRARKQQVSEMRSEAAKAANVKCGSGRLNSIQYRTWEFLCENDCNDGIHVSAVARAFGCSNGAANARLIVLRNLGYAKAVHKGYYRALTPENG